MPGQLQYRSVECWSLRKVIDEGQLTFECNNCWRLSAVDVLDLVERFGATRPLAGFGGRLSAEFVTREVRAHSFGSRVCARTARGYRCRREHRAKIATVESAQI
jgi:hypothetical protein